VWDGGLFDGGFGADGCAVADGGGEGVVRLFSGVPHGFIAIPDEMAKSAREGKEVVREFLREKMAV